MNLEETVNRAKKRLRTMQDREILDWSDAAISGIMQHLEKFRRTREEAHLLEALEANTVMGVAISELIISERAKREEDAR